MNLPTQPNNVWKIKQLQLTIKVIQNAEETINNREDAIRAGVKGSKTLDKVEEIATTGQLRLVEHHSQRAEFEAVLAFLKIHGVGPSTASRFVANGWLALEDLHAHRSELTRTQQIGLDLYEDLNTKIPRAEVCPRVLDSACMRKRKDVEKVCRCAGGVGIGGGWLGWPGRLLLLSPDSTGRGSASQVSDIFAVVKRHACEMDSSLVLEVCGSYRRGKPSCGDIDILISHPSGGEMDGLLARLVRSLTDSGFVTHHLTSPEDVHGSHGKFMGTCRLLDRPAARHRRLDLIATPWVEWGAALLYFTGSAHFNRSMRLLASTIAALPALELLLCFLDSGIILTPGLPLQGKTAGRSTRKDSLSMSHGQG